jgi:hypothetical protein
MPSAKFTQTYEKVSKMGEKLKAAGKQGPSNDEQLNVRVDASPSHVPRKRRKGLLDESGNAELTIPCDSSTPTPKSPKAPISAPRRSRECSI